MKQELLKISIVIPVYNRQEGLNKLLLGLSKSIVLGSFEEQVEVIIIDDASENLVKLQDDYPCVIKLQRNEKNSGAPCSREKGFHLFYPSISVNNKLFGSQRIHVTDLPEVQTNQINVKTKHLKSGKNKFKAKYN